jgi:hypothetical protein
MRGFPLGWKALVMALLIAWGTPRGCATLQVRATSASTPSVPLNIAQGLNT